MSVHLLHPGLEKMQRRGQPSTSRNAMISLTFPAKFPDPSRSPRFVSYRVDFQRAVDERSEEHTSELQSRLHLVCRLLLEKKTKVQQHAPLRGLQQQPQESHTT